MPTFKGTFITAFDATPPTHVNARLHGGVQKVVRDQFELADTANADIAPVLKLPVDAIIDHVYLAADDLGTAGTLDISIFKKAADGTYTAVLGNAFANNIDVSTAAVARTDYRFSTQGIETANQTLWELAGLSARPAYNDMYVGLTTDTGTTAAGTVYLSVAYTE